MNILLFVGLLLSIGLLLKLCQEKQKHSVNKNYEKGNILYSNIIL